MVPGRAAQVPGRRQRLAALGNPRLDRHAAGAREIAARQHRLRIIQRELERPGADAAAKHRHRCARGVHGLGDDEQRRAGGRFGAQGGASDTSPLTARPSPAAARSAARRMPRAGWRPRPRAPSGGTGGSWRARALRASSGRPRNSYDLASSSQSSALPPPLARRASQRGNGGVHRSGAGGGAELAVAAEPAGAVESALFDMHHRVAESIGCGRPRPERRRRELGVRRANGTDRRRRAATAPAPMPACQEALGSAARRGIVRSHGSSRMSAGQRDQHAGQEPKSRQRQCSLRSVFAYPTATMPPRAAHAFALCDCKVYERINDRSEMCVNCDSSSISTVC